MTQWQIDKCFEPDEHGFRVRESIRARTNWQLADLLKLPALPPSDLLLFRNVAIYLRSSAMSEIWQRLATSLVPGGYLVIGKSERPPQELNLVRLTTSVYQKMGQDK